MAKSITSEVIDLKGVILSFPKLFRPESVNGGEPKFGCNFLLDPNDPDQARQVKTIKAAAEKIAREFWGDAVPKSLKFCWGDGDEKDYEGYEGKVYVSASNNRRPLALDRDASSLTEEDDKLYPGAIVNGKITLWTQDNQFGKRINANLLGVQRVRDGERLGGGSRVTADDFAPVDDEGGAEPEGLFD